MPEVYGLDAASIQRIVSALKRVEGTSTSLNGDAIGKSQQQPGIWAKITGKQKPGNANNPNTGYSWILQGIDKDSNVSNWTPAKTGNPFSAYEANNNDNVPNDTIVWLYTNGNGNWEFSYPTTPITTGLYCAQGSDYPDCVLSPPIFTDVDNDTEKTYFSSYFNVFHQYTAMTAIACNPGTVLVDWTGFTVQIPHYQMYPTPTSYDVACQTQILQFVDPTSTPDGDGNVQPAPGFSGTNYNVTDSFDIYPVYWQITQPDPIVDNAACKCVGDETTRKVGQVQAYVAVKLPTGCNGGFDVVTDVVWDGTTLSKVYQTVTVENGLITDCGTSTTATITTPTTCP